MAKSAAVCVPSPQPHTNGTEQGEATVSDFNSLLAQQAMDGGASLPVPQPAMDREPMSQAHGQTFHLHQERLAL